MAKYTMPDGNLYDFSSDDEATKAMTAWQKQFGNEESSVLDRVGSGISATARTAGNLVGMASQLPRALGEFVTTDADIGTAMARSESSNPMTYVNEWSKPNELTQRGMEVQGEGLEALGHGLGRVVRGGANLAGMGLTDDEYKKRQKNAKTPEERAYWEKLEAAEVSASEYLGNFVPLPFLGKGKGKPKETPKAHEDILKAIDEDLNKKTNYADAYKEWNSIDSQLGKAKNPYRAGNRNKDWLDENNMPVMETIGEAPKFDPNEMPDKTGTLPPVPEGMIRLYRGESAKVGDVPDWVMQGLKENGSLNAQGRWWSQDLEIANWYKNDAGENGRVVWQDVPADVVAKAQVSTLDDMVKKFSLDPANEFFLPAEYVGKGNPMEPRYNHLKNAEGILKDFGAYDHMETGNKPSLYEGGRGQTLAPLEKTKSAIDRWLDWRNSNARAGKINTTGSRGMRGAIPKDLLGIGKVYDLLKELGPTELLKKFKGTFDRTAGHQEALATAIGDSIDPKSRARLVWMSPSKFLELAKERFPSSRPDLTEVMRERAATKIKSIRNGLRSEKGLTSIPMLGIDSGTVMGHEGRHRAHTFERMGVDLMPVILRDAAHRVESGPLPYHQLMSQNKKIVDISDVKEIFPNGQRALGQTKIGNSQRGSVPDVGQSPLLKGLFKAFGEKKDKVETTKYEGQVSTQEATKALPGANKAWEGNKLVPETIPELLKEHPEGREISPFEAGRIATTHSGLGLAARSYKSPYLQAGFQWFANARRNTTNFINDFVQPLINRKSEYNFNRIDKGTLEAYTTALQKYEGKGPIPDHILQMFPENVRKFHDGLLEAQGKALEAVNKERALQGEKPIEPRPGFMASMFEGNYRALVTDGHKVVEVISGRSLKELNSKIEARKDKINKEHSIERLDFDSFPGVKVTDAQSKYAYTRLMDMLGDDPRANTVGDVIQQWEQRKTQNLYGENQHFKFKNDEALPGAKGLDPTKTASENAHDYLEAQVQYIEQSMRWAENRAAFRTTGDLIKELQKQGDKYTNTISALEDYRANAVGIRRNMLGEMSDVMDKQMSKWFKDGGLPDWSNNTRAYLNAYLTGGLNLPFQLLQLTQALYALPRYISLKKEFGLSTVDISKALVKGTLDVSYPTSALAKEARQWGYDNNVIKSTIHSDVREMRNPNLSHAMDTWNLGTTTSDTVSRGAVYMSFVDLLKDKVPKKDLFQMAEHNTNAVMTEYNAMETPMMFSSGGTVGQNLGFFRKFLGNTLNQATVYANRGEVGALGALAGVMLFQSGLLGGIGVGTYESIAALWNSSSTALEYGKMPSLRHALLTSEFGKSYPLVRDVMGWGAMSQIPRVWGGKPLDLQSKSSFADIIPKSTTDVALAGVGSIGDLALAAGKAALNPGKESFSTLAYQATPSSAKGLAEEALFSGKLVNGRQTTYNPNDPTKQSYPRDATDRAYRAVGGRSLEEAQYKLRQFDKQVNEREIKANVDKAVHNWVYTQVHNNTVFARSNALKKLETISKDVPMEQIFSKLNRAMVDANLPPDKRELLTQDIFKLKRYMDYGP